MLSSLLYRRVLRMSVLVVCLGCLFSGTLAAQAAEPDYTSALFGAELFPAGDVNGDGYDDVLVAAHMFDGSKGKAFLFNGSAQGPVIPAAWSMTGSANTDYYGQRMAAGDFNNDGYNDIAIGARGYGIDNGKVDVYLGSKDGPRSVIHWSVEGSLTHSAFGYAIAAGDVNGDGVDDLIVGAPSDHGDPADYWEGRVFIYAGSKNGLSKTPLKILEGNHQYSRFGAALATADVNGDGKDDVLVGAYQWGYQRLTVDHQSREGRAAVFHGSDSGPAATPNWTAEGNQVDAVYGQFVASAGDVNNDGYEDVLVSAYLYDVTAGSSLLTDAGLVHLFLGSASGLGATPAWVGEGKVANASFGMSIHGGGDVNKDGFDDVVIAENTPELSPPGVGRVYVYLGSASGLKQQPVWTKVGDQEDSHYGQSSILAGDTNNDGYDDVIVAAYRYDDKFVDEGHIWDYRGSAQGLQSTAFMSTGPTGEPAEVTGADVFMPCMLSDR